MNTQALHKLSYGVYVVSTMDNDRPTGCVANSAMQITSSPATIAVSINHDNYTNKCISETGRLAVNIISENTTPSIIGTFGFQSGRDVNKFDTVAYCEKDGLPVIKEACAYFVCHVVDKMETATHTVFLCEIDDCDVLDNNEPMTYAYYHKVIKGKAPKNAPTYIPEEDTKKEDLKEETKVAKKENVKWVCSICGYVYDGEIPFEDLPDDWTCPLCGAPKEVFEKQTEEISEELKEEVIEASKQKEVKWVCSICGYIYDGEVPFEDLPDDWTCPLCGAPKEVFEKKEM